MKKLCVFDVDGVLADSWPMHHKFFCDMAEKYQPGLIIPPITNGPSLVTNGMEKFLQKVGFTEPVLKPIIDNEYCNFSENYFVPLFAGINGLIQDLYCLTNLVIVSANNTKNVHHMLGELHASFDQIITHGEFPNKKEALLWLLEKYQLTTNDLLFIGDTLSDYQSANEAEVTFIGAGYGWQIRPGDKLGCLIAENVSDLYELIIAS